MNSQSKCEKVSLLILAAGTSGRMGINKASLFSNEGSSFLEYLLKCYIHVGLSQIVVIINQETNITDQMGVRFITNYHPEKGRNTSIAIGIKEIKKGNACLIQNIDNPYFENTLLDQLIHTFENDSIVIPTYNGKGGHPLLIGPDVVEYLKSLRKIEDFKAELSRFKQQRINWSDEGILLNINTPEDYAEYRSQHNRESGTSNN
jgi:molybdenum cofactor cytidylyltransferase